MTINDINPSVNFRDLGVYTNKDGRKIKSGLLYRSGGLYLMNEEEKEFFKSLNIKAILDLRTSGESEAKPDPVFENVEMIRHSGVVSKGGEEIDFSPTGMKQFCEGGYRQIDVLHQYYRQMPFENEALHILMAELRKHNVPIVFHCATGKDRTGVAAMMILSALEVEEEVIFNDYMLSAKYHEANLKRVLEEDKDKIEGHPEYETLLTMMTSVTPETGRLIIDEIKNRYGTLIDYVKQEYKFSDEELKQFQDYYLQ